MLLRHGMLSSMACALSWRAFFHGMLFSPSLNPLHESSPPRHKLLPDISCF